MKALRENTINYVDRTDVLPQWLDALIFNELSAKYEKKKQELIVLKWNFEDILGYLGTYFPRSYSESKSIFSNYFKLYQEPIVNKAEVSILDFGCGTGGEFFGLVDALINVSPNIKRINLHAIDGNVHALRILEQISNKYSEHYGIEINCQITPIVVDDIYDMQILTNALVTPKFDIMLAYKSICEFVTLRKFEERNPYEHILNLFLPNLSETGIICLADITSFNSVSKNWIPKMIDNGILNTNSNILLSSSGYSETYTISHSHKKNDISKIAWRIINKTSKA